MDLDKFSAVSVVAGEYFLDCQKILLQNGLDIRTVDQYADFIRRIRAFLDAEAPFERPKSSVFKALQDSMSYGDHRERFPVGKVLPDTWADLAAGKVYPAPLRIVDYRKMEIDNHLFLVATLLRVHVHSVRAILKESSILARGGDENQGLLYCSVISQYLNAFGSYDKWNCRSWKGVAATELGYLSGCSQELLDIISSIVVNTRIYGLTDRKYYGSDSVVAKFFLPSPEQLHVELHDRSYFEQETWEYFRDTCEFAAVPCRKRIFTDAETGTAQTCWLRGAFYDGGNTIWSVHAGGSVSTHRANEVRACAPACTIAVEIEPSKA